MVCKTRFSCLVRGLVDSRLLPRGCRLKQGHVYPVFLKFKIELIFLKNVESESDRFNFKKGESEFLIIQISPNELIQ